MADRELAGEIFAGGPAIVLRAHVAAFILFDATALEHPVAAHAG